MRKFLLILGGLALAIIVAAGIGIGVLIYKGNSLDTESKAFVDSAVPAIAAIASMQPGATTTFIPPGAALPSQLNQFNPSTVERLLTAPTPNQPTNNLQPAQNLPNKGGSSQSTSTTSGNTGK